MSIVFEAFCNCVLSLFDERHLSYWKNRMDYWHIAFEYNYR